MPDIYCGIGKVPKNSRLGSMKECAENGQIRYYGLKKIDTKIIEATKAQTAKVNSVDKLKRYIIKLDGRIKRLNGIIKYSKKEDEVKEAKSTLKKTKEEQDKYKKQYKQMMTEAEAEKKKASKKGTKKQTGGKKASKKGTKKGSKKGSKKSSKKRASTKKASKKQTGGKKSSMKNSKEGKKKLTMSHILRGGSRSKDNDESELVFDPHDPDYDICQ